MYTSEGKDIGIDKYIVRSNIPNTVHAMYRNPRQNKHFLRRATFIERVHQM